MPRFDDSDDSYTNVNGFADAHGLLWDGIYGSPDVESLIDPQLVDARLTREYSILFDHTKCFKPRGSGARRNVLAISSPYVRDSPQLRAHAEEFARKSGLAVLVNHAAATIYRVPATLPILFWRPDLYTYTE